MPATRKLAVQSDPADVRRRVTAALTRMYPYRSSFTLPEVMEALHVIGELKG
jgi:hypothetical protein